MKSSDLKDIEAIIQYEFNNKFLLQQAFMFNQNDNENDPQSSEILRIIGKRTINFSTTQILMGYYGFYAKNGIFKVSNDNVVINDLLNNLYSKDIFARNIEILGLDKYLSIPDDGIMKDINRKLFEAIVGAVALDCKWNMPIINDVLSYILDIDFYLDNGFESLENNFVYLVYNWTSMVGGYPIYAFDAYVDEAGNYIYNCKLFLQQIEGYFESNGNSKSEVRMAVAKQAYDYLVNNNYISSLHNVDVVPDLDNAMKQLEKLAMEGYFSLPEFEVEELDNGYICCCSIDECDKKFKCEGSTDVEAINASAYKMLLYVLGYEEF